MERNSLASDERDTTSILLLMKWSSCWLAPPHLPQGGAILIFSLARPRYGWQGQRHSQVLNMALFVK